MIMSSWAKSRVKISLLLAASLAVRAESHQLYQQLFRLSQHTLFLSIIYSPACAHILCHIIIINHTTPTNDDALDNTAFSKTTLRYSLGPPTTAILRDRACEDAHAAGETSDWSRQLSSFSLADGRTGRRWRTDKDKVEPFTTLLSNSRAQSHH